MPPFNCCFLQSSLRVSNNNYHSVTRPGCAIKNLFAVQAMKALRKKIVEHGYVFFRHFEIVSLPVQMNDECA